MEDLYYLTPANIQLGDIMEWAAQQGYQSQRFVRGEVIGEVLNVLFEVNDYCQISCLMEESIREFSKDREISNIKQGFYIEYRGVTPHLTRLLQQLMSRFGGWIDCATESRKGMFTVENIDQLDCITLIMEESDEDE